MARSDIDHLAMQALMIVAIRQVSVRVDDNINPPRPPFGGGHETH